MKFIKKTAFRSEHFWRFSNHCTCFGVFFLFLQDTILGCFGFSLQRMMTGDLSRFKQIFVFDAGQVVEKGPPEELLIKVTRR